ncbi:MAG: response regulator [Planctomycetota bacterium]
MALRKSVGHSCRAASVLLVERDGVTRDRLNRALLSDGYSVVAVSHPRMALEASTVRKFNAAVVDVALPEYDGFALMEQLRRRASDLNVILITGDPDAPTESEARSLGAAAYLRLPCQLRRIESAVQSVLSDVG